LTPRETKRLLDYSRADLEGILREIVDKRPDLIIEDTRPQYTWLVPELNALEPGFLDDYAIVAEENGIRVLRRKAAAAVRASSDRQTPDR
jgi:hypothetical protein